MIDDDACDEMERQIEIAPKSHERRELYKNDRERARYNEMKPKKEMPTRKKQSRINQKILSFPRMNQIISVPMVSSIFQKRKEGAHRRREGIQVSAEKGSGEADQIRHAYSGVHVSDRLPREHAAGRHYKARA